MTADRVTIGEKTIIRPFLAAVGSREEAVLKKGRKANAVLLSIFAILYTPMIALATFGKASYLFYLSYLSGFSETKA